MKKSNAVSVKHVVRLCTAGALAALIAWAGLGLPLSAQQVQVGDNVNVLPVYQSNPDDGLDFLRGDAYAQRQGEPAIAFSSVNPDHVLAFYNDFRAVQLADEPGLPDFTTSPNLVARLWRGTTSLVARLLGRPAPTRTPPPVAAREAGGGMSVSYDGGLTWIGGFMPGLPYDSSPASSAIGTRLEAMADPVLLSGACGRFYAFFLYFTRGGQSKQMLARFQDFNNDELNHTIKFLGFTELDSVNNAGNGQFVDKLSAALIPTGATDCAQVTETLVATYTTFTGQGTGGKFQSKINFAKSIDGGKTFTKEQADKNFTQNQGTSIAVNPVTKDIYVFWRSFNSPHTMVVRKQRANGVWENPVDLLAGDPPQTTLAFFDQPTRSTLDTPVGGEATMKNQLAFRANAFPAAAYTPDGNTLIVTWHEKGNPATGAPDPNGTPMIMWKYSTDGGRNWSARTAITPATTPASPAGLGFFSPTSRSRGPQVIPSISCTAGSPNRCLVTFYESRPFSGADATSGLSANGTVGGYDRILDLRGVLIDAPKTNIKASPNSFQLSRYTYRTLADGELPQETTGPNGDVEKICAPGNSHCADALNFSGRPHTGGGTSPFMHDYTTIEPVVRWVKDKTSGAWRFAKDAADVPYAAGFGVAWADNRNVMQPYVDSSGGVIADGSEWQYFSTYRPAGFEGSCGVNFGSRNQDVMFAKVSLGLLITAPTNFKPFPNGGVQIEFPMTIWNNTGATRTFNLTVTGNASFAKADALPLSHKTGKVTINPYGSTSINLYAFDGSPASVAVAENVATSPMTGSITFNAPGAAPPADAGTPTYTSSNIAATPVPNNPVPNNPVPNNPVPNNPVPNNATVFDTIDYSWTVTPTSQNDAGTYLSFPNIDRAYANDYIFQVFVTKPSTRYAMGNCQQPGNVAIGSLVGHISDPTNPVPNNPVPNNPVPNNPVPNNATISDVLIQNTSFTLESNTTATAPGSSAATFAALTAAPTACDATTGAGLIGQCTLFGPRPLNQVTITVRAYQITPTDQLGARFDPFGTFTGTANPPSVVVADYGCTGPNQGCVFVQDGPDLVVSATTASTDKTVVEAGGSVRFPVGGISVTNAGNRDAGNHNYKIYLSTASTVAQIPRNVDGTFKENTGPGVVTIMAVASSPHQLATGGLENIAEQDVTVPANIPRRNADGTGTYYLYLYEDAERRVNELNENNNITMGGPITVRSPGYSFLGLFTPCSGLTCKKKTGSAFPLAFAFSRDGVTAVDSQSTHPRLKIYDPLAGGACRTTFPSDGSGFRFLSNPDDAAAGASLWQYFFTAGTRPAFTWQYNFQGKDPSTGANLPVGCYAVAVEVPATNQVIGGALGPVTTLQITLTK